MVERKIWRFDRLIASTIFPLIRKNSAEWIFGVSGYIDQSQCLSFFVFRCYWIVYLLLYLFLLSRYYPVCRYNMMRCIVSVGFGLLFLGRWPWIFTPIWELWALGYPIYSVCDANRYISKSCLCMICIVVCQLNIYSLEYVLLVVLEFVLLNSFLGVFRTYLTSSFRVSLCVRLSVSFDRANSILPVFP